MEIVDIFSKYGDLLLYIFFIISSFIFGYEMGNISSIKDDFKSLDYENILSENRILKQTIKILKKNK